MGSDRKSSVLYVTYDGLADPLGKSQVLPYVHGLAARGNDFVVLSFEKRGTSTHLRRHLGPRIRSVALRYHKRPTLPATVYDLVNGLGVATALDLTGCDFRLLHVRSYVAGAMVLPLAIARRIPLLFDMRGLWADERIEAGSWAKDHPAYKAAKAVERALLREATVVTVLTNSLRKYLREEYPYRSEIKAPIHVIPTCVDLDMFNPAIAPDRATLQEIGQARVLAYVGSLGGRYLPEVMARFYLQWRKGERPTRFLVISKEPPEAIRSPLQQAGVATELIHRIADRDNIASFIRCARAGVFFYREALSTRGTAPTKVGELLACGIPVAGNAVGDIASVLEGSGGGVVVRGMGDAELGAAASLLSRMEDDPTTTRRARSLAQRWFSLDDGIEAYQRIYDALRMVSRLQDTEWPAAPAPPRRR